MIKNHEILTKRNRRWGPSWSDISQQVKDCIWKLKSIRVLILFVTWIQNLMRKQNLFCCFSQQYISVKHKTRLSHPPKPRIRIKHRIRYSLALINNWIRIWEIVQKNLIIDFILNIYVLLYLLKNVKFIIRQFYFRILLSMQTLDNIICN